MRNRRCGTLLDPDSFLVRHANDGDSHGSRSTAVANRHSDSSHPSDLAIRRAAWLNADRARKALSAPTPIGICTKRARQICRAEHFDRRIAIRQQFATAWRRTLRRAPPPGPRRSTLAPRAIQLCDQPAEAQAHRGTAWLGQDRGRSRAAHAA
jgi:hypothetical protein